MGLWQVLRDGGGAQNVARIEELTKYAAGKLILVRETFPDYTLHDRQHAENVIGLIELLLGPDLAKLRPLEAAMLILAAYFHDIGMVYQPGELAALADDEDFRAFLDENPAAYIQVHEAGEIPRDIIVQYCRARHAKRVSEHLYRFEADKLIWSGAGIASQLAMLCRSHNEPMEAVRSPEFRTDFLTECDLRMCAILLRLADILDLDDSRSPLAVYEHLRLARAAEGPRAVSDAEWTKHISSRGFLFPAERTPNYPLAFVASPRHPAVESAIRKFLDVVDQELRGCRILLDFCDQRWRSLPLPGSVDRSNITGIGYHYGEYRFSLDRHEVLNLFMGDQLYGDPYVFIRELLQNAIDACRLNVYLHDVPQDSMEVRVSAWEDETGCYWLRVDDTGVGMDQGIVERYFLGVGRSYYRSDELQADILRKNRPQQKFVAISRFGIGVLSSFIVGDRIEVSTRRRLPDGTLASPLRLSLDSLDDFFVMQEEPNQPAPFPGRAGPEEGYRKSAGTSVAVRIDPAKSDVSLQRLTDTARESFFYPPVRVYLNDGQEHHRVYAELDTPLLDDVVRYPLTADGDGGDTAWTFDPRPLRLLATAPVTLLAIPLNVTAAAPSPAIRGQLVAFSAEAAGGASLLPALPWEIRDRLPGALARSLRDCVVTRKVTLEQDSSQDVKLILRLGCREQAVLELREWLNAHRDPDPQLGHDLRNTMRTVEWMLNRELPGLPPAGARNRPPADAVVHISARYSVGLTELVGPDVADTLKPGNYWLGHNGIRITTWLDGRSRRLDLMAGPDFVLLGPLCLFDELRPDVSVSRDALRNLSFEIQSALHLAVRKAAGPYLSSPVAAHAQMIMDSALALGLPEQEVTAGQIGRDPLLPQWRGEPLLPLSGDRLCSAADVRRRAAKRPVSLDIPVGGRLLSRRPLPYDRGFYRTLLCALAEADLDIELEPRQAGDGYTVAVRGAGRPTVPAGLSVLPPLTVIGYDAPDVLLIPGCPANLRHPLVGWFAANAALLQADYPAFFAQFRRTLLEPQAFARGYPVAHALDVLNGTLSRIRRSFPGASGVLAVQVYADADGWLRTRPPGGRPG